MTVDGAVFGDLNKNRTAYRIVLTKEHIFDYNLAIARLNKWRLICQTM